MLQVTVTPAATTPVSVNCVVEVLDSIKKPSSYAVSVHANLMAVEFWGVAVSEEGGEGR